MAVWWTHRLCIVDSAVGNRGLRVDPSVVRLDLVSLPFRNLLKPPLSLGLVLDPRGEPLHRQRDAQFLHTQTEDQRLGTVFRSERSGKSVDQWLTTHGSKAEGRS